MTVQQYLLPISEDLLQNGKVGAMVYKDDNSEELTGFISDLDEDFVEITLFAPMQDFPVPSVIVLKESLTPDELTVEFRKMKDRCDEGTLKQWVQAVKNTLFLQNFHGDSK